MMDGELKNQILIAAEAARQEGFNKTSQALLRLVSQQVENEKTSDPAKNKTNV